jgi:hypothetical protein
VPITRAPAALGNLHRGDPTRPAAEWTTTDSPGLALWQLWSMCHAVNTAVGNEAARSKFISSGIAMYARGANERVLGIGTHPDVGNEHSDPQPFHIGATDAMTPAASTPGVSGNLGLTR